MSQTMNPDNVVSIFRARKTETAAKNTASTEATSQDISPNSDSAAFLEEMRRNAEKVEKMRQERLKANQGVLKSYRIKN